MDPLKEYIDKNRADFDELNPPALIWRSIEMEMDHHETKVVPFYKQNWLRIASVAVVFLVVGLGVGQYLQENTTPHYADSSSWEQYLKAEEYLQQRVNYTREQIGPIDKVSTLEEDLNKLDEVFLELKKELQNSHTGNSDVIINAMIHNYNTKVEILERVLDKKQAFKKEKYYEKDLDI